MIKNFAKPFNIVFRTEESLNKKIESIKDQIEFEKYKLQNNSVETLFFTEEENKERIAKLEKELKYYQEIVILKDVDCYMEGVIGGEIIMAGSWLVGTVIGLGIRKLRK